MSFLSDLEKEGVPKEILESLRTYYREDYDPNNQLHLDENVIVDSLIYRVSTADLGVNIAVAMIPISICRF